MSNFISKIRLQPQKAISTKDWKNQASTETTDPEKSWALNPFIKDGMHTHNIYTTCFEVDKLKGEIHTDLTGWFPVTSSQGNTYICVLYNYHSKVILVEPLQNCSVISIVKGVNLSLGYFWTFNSTLGSFFGTYVKFTKTQVPLEYLLISTFKMSKHFFSRGGLLFFSTRRWNKKKGGCPKCNILHTYVKLFSSLVHVVSCCMMKMKKRRGGCCSLVPVCETKRRVVVLNVIFYIHK